MKVVKLSRRHKAFSKGFTHAMRFESWCGKARMIETILRERYGPPRLLPWFTESSEWCADFGHKRSNQEFSPYWINFRNEADITLLLLTVDL
jgi:hypothetical protein